MRVTRLKFTVLTLPTKLNTISKYSKMAPIFQLYEPSKLFYFNRFFERFVVSKKITTLKSQIKKANLNTMILF